MFPVAEFPDTSNMFRFTESAEDIFDKIGRKILELQTQDSASEANVVVFESLPFPENIDTWIRFSDYSNDV